MSVLRALLCFMLITSLTITPAYADELSDLKNMVMEMKQEYEYKINQLENKIEKLERNQNQITQNTPIPTYEEIPTKGLNVDYVGRYDGPFEKGGLVIENPSGFGNVSIGGYMDHEFENFENTDSTFDQHRWIINIGAHLGERLHFYSEYEIEHGGPSVGGEGKVEQAYIDFLMNDAINLRMGAVLVPFGRTNLYHDSDLRNLTSRPLVARDIIPTTWTEAGVGLYGSFEPDWKGLLDELEIRYETYVMNGLDEGFSDTGLRGARGSLGSDNNNAKSIAARVTLSPAIGQEMSFSGYTGHYNDAGDNIVGGAVDFLSQWGPVDFVGEYAYFDVDQPSGSADIADMFQGYRLQGNYHFWFDVLNNTILGRSFDDPTFTLSARYGWAQIDDDADSGTGDNEEERITLGLNYRPLPSWVMKMEYQWNTTENESLERGDNDGWFWSVAMGF